MLLNRRLDSSSSFLAYPVCTWFSNCRGVVIAGAASVGLNFGNAAYAQFWTLEPAATSVVLDTYAVTTCVTPCGPLAFGTSVFIPGLDGDDITYFSQALCKMAATATCGCKAHGWARIGIRGVGTATLRIRAEGYSRVKHRCNFPVTYYAEAIGDIEPSTLGLSINTGGIPRTVYYKGDGVSFASHDPEGGGDDWTVVGLPATSLVVNGIPMFPFASLDLPFVRGSLRREFDGSFNTGGSDAVPVDLQGGTWAVIQRPPKSIGTPGHQGYYEWDYEYCGFVYNLTLRVNTSIPEECPEPLMLFSQDIGADTERSDSTFDGNEAFEPFDVYASDGGVLSLPMGADGILTDDASIAADIAPVVPGGLGAPTCSALPVGPATTSNLDLDGTDSIDFSLAAAIASWPQTPLGALQFPMPAASSDCVHRVENLIISYDDDTAEHFVGGVPPNPCPIPVGSGSPISQTYGSTPRRDEVLGLTLGASGPLGYAYGNYPLRNEEEVHGNMAPNPPFTPPVLPEGSPVPPQDADDDVDALDLVPTTGGCSTWLFGVDHEARNGFGVAGPTNIFQWTPGGGAPIPVVNGVTHLGLAPTTDVRDFELVRANDLGGGPGEYYALVFAVAPDDPLTVGDESGGLDPAMIYISYLTGTSSSLLDFPLDDAVDGIAAWCRPLADPAEDEPCPADLNNDGMVSTPDLLIVINNWGPCAGCPADLNGSGGVSTPDLLIVINAWGPCP